MKTETVFVGFGRRAGEFFEAKYHKKFLHRFVNIILLPTFAVHFELIKISKMTDIKKETGTLKVKRGLAEMLKCGVIMDVVTPEQAKIAEEAGAVAVMALERVPSDIRAQGGVARMSDPEMISGIQNAVSIPVMAKARIGHIV